MKRSFQVPYPPVFYYKKQENLCAFASLRETLLVAGIRVTILCFFMGWPLFFFPLAFAENEKDSSESRSLENHAENLARKPRVSVILSLERYEFWIDRMPGPSGEEQEHVIQAAFALVNNSGSDIQFAFLSHCGEDKQVQFILRDAAGNSLWQHIVINPLIKCPDYVEYRTLPDKGRFLYSVEVPMMIDGELLAPGEYIVEAFVDGYPLYGAYAPFRVDYAY